MNNCSTNQFFRHFSYKIAVFLVIFGSTICIDDKAYSQDGMQDINARADQLERELNAAVQNAEELVFWSQKHTQSPSTVIYETDIPYMVPKGSRVPGEAPIVRLNPAETPQASPTVQTKPAQPIRSQPVQKYEDTLKQPRQKVPPPAEPTNKKLSEKAKVKPEAPKKKDKEQNFTLSELVDISGKYRMSFGVGRNRNWSFNDSNADFQDRDKSYLFGERLNNTFDHAIYNSYETNIDAKLNDRFKIHTKLVADPWAYTATTDEIRVENNGSTDHFNAQFKYIGANNSTIQQTFRTDDGNAIAAPSIEATDGKTSAFTSAGFTDFNTTYDIPAAELDYEFNPIREAWVDYRGDHWKMRFFPMGGEDQIITADDPLSLTNNKDFWQHSAWLDDWRPIQTFSDGSIRRGYYDDEDAFFSRHTDGTYLTRLRGFSMEGEYQDVYLSSMVASRHGLWDDYGDVNNVPGVIRAKYQLNPKLSLGGLYTVRAGMIDNEIDSKNQVGSVDVQYHRNKNSTIYGQAAVSNMQTDILSSGNSVSPGGLESDYTGGAWRLGLKNERTHTRIPATTKSHFDVAWMDTKFNQTLSRYTSLRDDELWGRYVSFRHYSPEVEPFKLGTGLDRGRYVGRATFETAIPSEGIHNLFDIRHVRDTDSHSFIENVLRDELTWQITPKVKGLGMVRWHILPKTIQNREPFISSFGLIDEQDPVLLEDLYLQNVDIEGGLDPSRKTFGGGFQYTPKDEWTLELVYTRTNDIHDFPRGLQNDTFRGANIADPNHPGLLLDKLQPFIYNQDIYDLPPYKYFSIFKERAIYSPYDGLKLTLHAAQNSNELWGPIDENVTHQGISIVYKLNDDWSLFTDYTHSVVADIPHLIGSNFGELDIKDHHNFYALLKRKFPRNTSLNIEYGVFGRSFYEGSEAVPLNTFAVTDFYLPTIDTEHLVRVSFEGEF